jgi:hypothetical protein
MNNRPKAPQTGKKRGRLLATGFLPVIYSTSSAPAAVILTDDNRYVVTSSHDLLPIILLLALLLTLAAVFWIIQGLWFRKRARHNSKTTSSVAAERQPTANRKSCHETQPKRPH